MLGAVIAAKTHKLKFVVYTHEIRGGPNVTLLAAAGTGQGNFSALGWGSFLTVDNLLVDGPAADSPLVGSFTGVAAITTKGGIADGGLFAVDQFRFGPASKYNGSTISVIGTGYVISTPYLPTTAAPVFVFKWDFSLSKLH
jgi:hypothetical protein